MLEDSITSSPSKCNKSIHKIRLLRKNRRKKLDQSVKNDDKQQNDLQKIVHDFYKDFESEEELEDKNSTFLVSKPSAIVENYKPFEMEKRLAMADRLLCNQQNLQYKKTEFPETQGFFTCQKLNENENSKVIDDTAKRKQESSFLITESELLNCCHQAEKELRTSPITVNDAINNSFSKSQNLTQYSLNIKSTSSHPELELVNSILQEFSLSPVTKEQLIESSSWILNTPEFRLQRKPTRTYSRNNSKRNLSKCLESIAAEDGDSNSSSLSVHQDITPLEGVSNPDISIMDTSSQSFCENLLNLRTFLTQKFPTAQNSLNDDEDLSDHSSAGTSIMPNNQGRILRLDNISTITQEILTLRSRYPNKLRTDSYNSSEDIYGFSSPKSKDENIIDAETKEYRGILDITIDAKSLEKQVMDNRTDVNTKEYKDWNEDDCEDVFACINTDEILLQNKKSSNYLTTLRPPNMQLEFIEPNLTKIKNKENKIVLHESVNEIQNSTKLMGFKTASSKRIKVSRDAHIMAAKILSKLPDIKNKSNAKKCDNVVISKDSSTTKDENIFVNPDNYEWNDDSDFFMNFQTPANLKQNISNTLKCNEDISNEKFTYLNDMPSTSKMAMKANIDFQTASGKNVAISKKAQQSVQKLLGEFQTETNENCEGDELKEMKNKIYTKTHNVKSSNSSCSRGTKEFSLRRNEDGNNMEKCDKRFDEDGERKRGLCNTANDTPQFGLSNVILNEGFPTAKGKNIQNYTAAQQSANKHLSDLPYKNYQNVDKNKLEISKSFADSNYQQEIITKPIINDNINNMGFQKANGKRVKISIKAQQSVQKLLHEFHTSADDNLENNLEVMKNQIYKKNNITSENSGKSHSLNENKLEILAKGQPSTEMLFEKTNVDFNDDLEANKKFNSIQSQISNFINNEELQRHFSENNEDFDNIILSEWPLNKEVKTNKTIELSNSKSSNSFNKKENIEYDKNPRNAFPTVPTKNFDINNSTNVGFQTGRGNTVFISVKAQQSVNKMLKEFTTDLNENNYDENLLQIKSNLERKNNKLKQTHNTTQLKPSPEDNEYNNIILSEWPISPKKDVSQNITPKQLNGKKRKLSIDNSDIPSPMANRSPPSKIINKGLYTTKSSFSELTIKSPINSSPASSIISRKNLLSLTKRRKIKRNSITTINNDSSRNIINNNEKDLSKINPESIGTPIKSTTSLRATIQTPATTPNLKEFFSNAPQTSTPRVDKVLKSSITVMDIDFKPIPWNNNEDSTLNKSSTNLNHSSKLSDSTCSNISINSSNPGAKDRIARLKMYGKAPAVSPIRMDTHDNRRHIGLRRTRSSMIKKTENE